MALCEKCLIYNKLYNELRQKNDDAINEKEKNVQKHFCFMYIKGIPEKITHKNADCNYYQPK